MNYKMINRLITLFIYFQVICSHTIVLDRDLTDMKTLGKYSPESLESKDHYMKLEKVHSKIEKLIGKVYKPDHSKIIKELGVIRLNMLGKQEIMKPESDSFELLGGLINRELLMKFKPIKGPITENNEKIIEILKNGKFENEGVKDLAFSFIHAFRGTRPIFYPVDPTKFEESCIRLIKKNWGLGIPSDYGNLKHDLRTDLVKPQIEFKYNPIELIDSLIDSVMNSKHEFKKDHYMEIVGCGISMHQYVWSGAERLSMIFDILIKNGIEKVRALMTNGDGDHVFADKITLYNPNILNSLTVYFFNRDEVIWRENGDYHSTFFSKTLSFLDSCGGNLDFIMDERIRKELKALYVDLITLSSIDGSALARVFNEDFRYKGNPTIIYQNFQALRHLFIKNKESFLNYYLPIMNFSN